MPENVQKVVIEHKSPQQQVEAFGKLVAAVNKMGGGAQVGPGQVTGIHASPEAATDSLKQLAEIAKEQKLKMGTATVTQTEGGDYKATASLQKKAFSTGGMVAGMATVVGGIGAGFAKLISLSQVFSTFMSTTGKILGTAVDLMLAPLMPIFVKIMVWIIQSIFPLATKIGNWVGGLLGDISGGGAVAALTAGYVGLKVAGSVLDSLGKSLGGALLSHFDADSFGSLISGGISKSVATLKDWGETAGLYVLEGMDKAQEALSAWYSSVATGISSAFESVKGTLSAWYTSIAGGISDAFSAVAGKLSGWYDTIAGGISDAFSTVTSTIGQWYDKVAGGISDAFSAVAGKLSDWYKTVAGGISSAFDAVVGTLSDWYKTVAGGISSAFGAAADTLGDWYKTVAGGISGAFDSVVGTLSKWYSTVAEGIAKAMSKTADTLLEWGKAVGIYVTAGIKSAKGLLETWGTAVGGFISAGIKGVGGAAKGTWNAIGGFIGSAVGLAGKAWDKVGKAIGSALSGASGWAKMGGMIGAGIGVVAIGGAIGYYMWKKWQQHEAGKDVFSEMLRGEAIPYIMQTYGLGEETAKIAYEKRVDIGTHTDVEDVYMAMGDMAKELKLYNNLAPESIARLELFTPAQLDFMQQHFIPDFEKQQGLKAGSLLGGGGLSGMGVTKSLEDLVMEYYMQDKKQLSQPATRGWMGKDTGFMGFGGEDVTDLERSMSGMARDYRNFLSTGTISTQMAEELGGGEQGLFEGRSYREGEIASMMENILSRPENKSYTININMDNVPHPITRNLFQNLEVVMDDPSAVGKIGF